MQVRIGGKCLPGADSIKNNRDEVIAKTSLLLTKKKSWNVQICKSVFG